VCAGAWSHGYATEAGGGALSFAQNVAALSEVVAFALKFNAASLAVMERLGFIRQAQIDRPRARIGCTARSWPTDFGRHDAR
jgi:RimJ/RimL family protein N-acetyltransferase